MVVVVDTPSPAQHSHFPGRSDGRRVGPGRRRKKGDHTGRTFFLSHMAWREEEKEGCLPGNEDFKRESGRI